MAQSHPAVAKILPGNPYNTKGELHWLHYHRSL
jgi:hypothetical protein